VGRQTKKKISLVVSVLVVAALALAYIWRVNQGPEDEPEETPAPTPQVFTLANRPQADVARIYVTQDGDVMRFLPGEVVFGQLTWYLADNPDLLLSRVRVQDKLRPAFSLNASERVHENAGELDLSGFGLDPPLLTLTAHGNDGTVMVLHLGSSTPDRRFHYLLMEGDPSLYAIPRFIAELMQLTTEHLLDRALPQILPERITYFRLAQRERDVMEFVHLPEKEIDAAFTALGVTPLTAVLPVAIEGRDIDNYSILNFGLESFAEEFAIGDVAEMFPDDLAPFGLDDPFIDFHFVSDEGEFHLLFGSFFMRDVNGANVSHVYVKFADRPHVFMAESAPLGHITDLNVMRFISRFVALVPIVDVERITVAHQEPARNLEIIINHDPAEGSNAISPTVNGYLIPETPFRGLYRALIGIGADAYLDPQKPEGTPIFTVTYHMLDGTARVVAFYAFDGNFHSFSVDGDYIWAVTNRRWVDLFFNEAQRLMEEAK
jgi:hypothetical protein